VWVAFTSATNDENIMSRFSGSNTGGTWITLDVTEGKNIASLSLCKEGEILLMPNSYFMVTEVESKQKDHLTMKQQPTPNIVKSMFY